MVGNTVKVLMHCVSSKGEDDHSYGKSGYIFRELQEKSGVPIEFVTFGGFLEGSELERFLEESKTAQVIITDGWNHPATDTGWTLHGAQELMARVVSRVNSINPLARIFSQLMEGRKVPAHRFAEPHDHYTDDVIIQAIKLSVKKVDARSILVFDDSAIHAEAAVKQLSADYNLTVVTTYDQAENMIRNATFDVVLLDVLVPASSKTLGGDGMKFAGQEMPLAPILAFLALSRGVKKIGILTDANHHAHPASAAIDVFHGPFTVGDVKIVISNDGIGFDGAKNWKRLLEQLDK